MQTEHIGKFPKDFTWGAASASYQIEGAAEEDGKGLSVWDMMCRQPGRIYGSQTGEIACDHYHRYTEDVSLFKQIGLKAYRFSVSWPRVLPQGIGSVNQKGLEFYDRLVDELLAAGIEPWVTLFHWDFPYELYCRGGWLNPDSPSWFADYAQIVTERLSDRVSHWITLNEPQCFIGLGLQMGRHAPGDRLALEEVLLASHHALLAHGQAVQAIRARAKKPPLIGWAPVAVAAYPANEESPADIDAARSAMFSIGRSNVLANPWDDTAVWNNTWWGDPVILGSYPEDGLKAFGAAMPRIRGGDMETISQPLDFYGMNIYHGAAVRQGDEGSPVKLAQPDGFPLTAFKWGVTPSCMYWASKFLQERYGLPIVVTENGMSGTDWISLDGRVHDPQRIDFLARYLREVRRAIRDGVDIRGYFHWSTMDNFEWAEGFKERFGLIYVDYATQKRTLKDSAHWYRDVIAANGSEL